MSRNSNASVTGDFAAPLGPVPLLMILVEHSPFILVALVIIPSLNLVIRPFLKDTSKGSSVTTASGILSVPSQYPYLPSALHLALFWFKGPQYIAHNLYDTLITTVGLQF
jgi:hypothetical protein